MKLKSLPLTAVCMSSLTSCVQTVVVEFPFSNARFHTMELRPILPAYMKRAAEQRVIHHSRFGKDTYWHPCGSVTVKCLDGTLKTWYPKPTLESAIKTATPYRCSFQFHKRGIVTAMYDDEPFYWSGPVTASPPTGSFTVVYADEEMMDSAYESDEAEYESAYYYNNGVDNA